MKLVSYNLKNVKIFHLIFVSLAVLLCLSIWLFINSEFYNADRCLDSGGRFNYETKKCEYG